jgi:hypothetical protein
MTFKKYLQWINDIKILNTTNVFPYFELIAKKILLKSLNPNPKHNLAGIFNFWFQKILINIDECNSRSKHTDMIYMSWFTTLVSKSSLNYASKLYFKTLFDNSGNLDYPQDFHSIPNAQLKSTQAFTFNFFHLKNATYFRPKHSKFGHQTLKAWV